MSDLYWGVTEYPKERSGRYNKFSTPSEAIEYAKSKTEHAIMGVWNHHYDKQGDLCYLVIGEGVFAKEE